MADSDTSQSQLTFREQAGGFGEAMPATPALQILRSTGNSFAHKNITITDDELRGDRQLADQLLVGQEVQGGFNFNFSSDTYDKFLESILTGIFTTGVLKNGILAQRYFMIEDQALDVAQFFLFRDLAINELNLDITSRQIVKGEANFMGTVGTIASAQGGGTAGATTTAATTTPNITAAFNVASLLINGAAIGVGVKSLKLNMKGNLRIRDEIGNLLSRPFGRGDIEISGSMQVYFANAAMWTLFKNNTFFAMSFVLTDITTGGKSYTFLLPKCKLSDDTASVGGKNQDRMENISFRCFKDSTTELATIKITKVTL